MHSFLCVQLFCFLNLKGQSGVKYWQNGEFLLVETAARDSEHAVDLCCNEYNKFRYITVLIDKN